MDNDKSAELVPPAVDMSVTLPGNALVVPRQWRREVDESAFRTSMLMVTPEDRVRVFNTMNDTDRIQNHVGETFEVCDIILCSRLIVDEETGEESPGVLMIMVRPQGPHYTTGSKVLIPQIARIHAMVRPAPWNPPLKIRVDEKQSQSGKRNRYYTATVQGV